MLCFVYCSYENFMGTNSEVICPYGINGLTGIFGENGMGKSTQIEAITFALYGSGIRSPYKTDYINSKVNGNTSVKCKFIYKSDTFEIERYMKHSSEKNAVRLYKNGSELTFKNTKDVTSYIENNICPKSVFIKTCIFPQKSTDTFISLKSSDRFKLFSEIINLDIYDAYYKIAAKRLKEFEELESKLSVSSESLLGKKNDIEGLKESYINEINKDNERIKSSINEIRRNIDMLNESIESFGISDYDQFESELNSTENFIKSVDKLRNKAMIDLEKNKSIMNNIFNNKTRELNEKLNSIEENIRSEIKSESKSLSNSVYIRKSEIDEILSNNYKKLNDKISSIRFKYDKKVEDIEVAINNIKTNELSDLNENKVKINTNKETIIKNLKDVEQKLSSLESMDPNAICHVCKRPLDETCKNALKSEKDRLEDELKNIGLVYNKILNNIEDKSKLIGDLNNKIIDERNKSENEIESYNKKIQHMVKGLQNEKNQLADKLENINEDISNKVHKKYNVIRDNLKAEIQKILDEHKVNESNLQNRYNETISNLEEQENTYKDRLKTLNKVRSMYNNIKENTSKIESLSKNIRDIKTEEYDNKLHDIDEELNNNETKRSDLNDSVIPMAKFVKEMMSDRGIKNYIVGRLLPEINTRVNSYLETIGSNHRIQVDNIKELKSGKKTKNEIYIKFFTSGIEKPINMASGGEQRLLDVIFFMVFYDIFSSQNSFNTNVLYFDEIFDSLDEKTCDSVFNLLKLYSNRLDVRVISHSDIWKNKDFDEVQTIE